MIKWEEVINPSFVDTIRGERYNLITEQQLYNELYQLTRKAINSFKFPRIDLGYGTYYTDAEYNIIMNGDKFAAFSDLTKEQKENALIFGYFTSDKVTDKEIEVIVAWMLYHWAKQNVSNADNFYDTYTDANIKTYSRANANDKYIKFLTTYRDEAKDVESSYYRTYNNKPTLGSINSEE